MKGSFVFRPLVIILFSVSAIAQGIQTLQYNREYKCGNERIAVAYCRRDSDRPGQRTPDAANFCQVNYLGQKTASGWPVEKAELRSHVESKLRACGALGSAAPAASPNSTTLNFNGLYVDDSETGSRRWLRFYEDGAVVGASVESSGTPEKIAVWLKKGYTNGQYTIRGSVIDFFVEFKTADGKIGKVTYSGTIGDNSLNVNFYSSVTGNRGTFNYRFVPLTGGAASGTIGGGTSGVTTVTSPGNAAFLRGRALVNAKNYTGAMVELKEALRLDPRHALAFYYVGIAQYYLKEYVVANAAFERALQLNVPIIEHHTVYVWIGECQKELGQHDKALSAYREAIRVKPNYAEAFNRIGLVYHLKKDFPNAVIFYEQAARLDPKTGLYRKNVGMAHIAAGKKDEAMKAYNSLAGVDARLAGELLDEITKPAATAAATKPRTPAELRLDDGNKFYNAKDYVKALAAYQEALSLDPANGEASHRIGMSRYQLKQYPEAIAAFENAVKLKYEYSHVSYDWIGDTHAMLKQYDKAVLAFREAVRLKPDYVHAIRKLGNTHFAIKQYAEALAAYQTAIRVEPDAPSNHAGAGDAYTALGQHDKAAASYREATRLNPKYDPALNALAVSHYRMKQYAAALPLIEQAVQLKPDNPLYLANLGDILFQLGRKADALAAQKRLAAIDKVRADELLARINTSPALEAADAAAEGFVKAGHKLIGEKEYAKALAEYQKAVAAKPHDVWLSAAHLGIGETYTYLRDYDRSITNLLVAARLDPTYGRVYESLGYAYYKTLQFPKAEAAYQEAIRLKPEDVERTRIMFYLGSAYALMGNRVEAMKIYESLKESEPTEAKSLLNEIEIGDKEGPAGIHMYFGRGLEFSGVAEEVVLEYFRNAAKLKATKLSVHFDAASGLNRFGKSAEAMALLQQILARKPVGEDLAQTHFLIGQTYSFMKEYAKAIPEIRKAQQIKVDNKYSYELGNSFFYLKQYPDALIAFQEAVKLEPDDTSSIIRLAETLVAMGQHDKASSYLSELTSGTALFPFQYPRIGELYFSMKRYPDAVAVYKKALASYPKNKSLHYELGVVYVAMGQKQDAMAIYRVLRPLDNSLAQKLLAEINKR